MAWPHIRNRHFLILAATTGLVLLIIAVVPYRHVSAPKPKPTAVAPVEHVVTHSSDIPSEVPVTKAYVSTAVGDEPKYLHLPSINAAGYIVKVGIDQNNQVASPGNVNLAGWYVNSLKPGQTGLSIIDGHVDGKKGPGMFLRLAKLKPNDRYDVELANGTTLQYAVQSVASLKVADVPAALFAHDPSIDSQLNLITCYGTFNYQSGEYDQRTIVVSKLIK